MFKPTTVATMMTQATHLGVKLLAAVVLVLGIFAALTPVAVQAARCDEVVVPLGVEVPENNPTCFLPNGAPCSRNSECASYLCSGSRCAGDRACSKPTFTNADVDFSRSCFETQPNGTGSFKRECNDGYIWNGSRCVAQSCASGWRCGAECASSAAVGLFDSTWCNGQARWKYESGNGQGISCGGSASELRSVRNCLSTTCRGAVPAVNASNQEACNNNGTPSRHCQLGYTPVDLSGFVDCYPADGGTSANPQPLDSCTSACPAGKYCVCPDNCPVAGRINPTSSRRVCTHETVTLARCNDTCPTGRVCNCPSAGCTRSGQITTSASERTCGGEMTYDGGGGECAAAGGSCVISGANNCNAQAGRVEHPSIRCNSLLQGSYGIACCVPATVIPDIANLPPCSDANYVSANDSGSEHCRKPDGTEGWVCRPGYSTFWAGRWYCEINNGDRSIQPMPLDSCTARCPDDKNCSCPTGCPGEGRTIPRIFESSNASVRQAPRTCNVGSGTPTPVPTPVVRCDGPNQRCAGTSVCLGDDGRSVGRLNCPTNQICCQTPGFTATPRPTPLPTPTPLPPNCGTGLECQVGAIPGKSACWAGSQAGYCCAAGERLVNGVCVLPTPGATCNNTEGRWVAGSVDAGGQCCGGGTLECKSGRCNASSNQIGSCLPALTSPVTPVPVSPSPTTSPTPTPVGGGSPGGGGPGQPSTPAPTAVPTALPTPTPRPSCTYTYSEWGACRVGLQTRQILTVTPTNCVGAPDPLVRTCGDEYKCETDADCATYAFCYQPPMPPCPEGMSCTQVMPPKECQVKKEVADINDDNKVNVTDLSVLLKNLLTADAKSDLNKDGVVDIIDYALLVRRLSEQPDIERTNR